MSDLEEIRKKKMQELLRQKNQQQVQQQFQKKQIDAQIKKLIHHILSPEARERLGNIRAAKPNFARRVEVLLIQLYQGGRIPEPLSDEQFKKLLKKLKQGRKKDITIKRG